MRFPLRKSLGLGLAPLTGLVFYLLPFELEPKAHVLLAIFVAVVILWVTEALPLAGTALMIAPAMVFAGVTDAKAAFAPYADPLLFLFVGGFMIANAMMKHGLDQRIAEAIVSVPWIAASGARTRAAFVALCFVLSMWVSNTAAAAILVPIFLGLSPDASEAGKRSLAGGLLGIAYVASIGGLGTPVGTPPNLITMGFLEQAGIELAFFDWVKVALPLAIAIAVAMFFLLSWLMPSVAPARMEKKAARPWTTGEIVTACVFGLAVAGWIIPGVYSALELPRADVLEDMLSAENVALGACVLLFLPDENGRRVLPWKNAVRIDWGIILLFGGGLSLGKQMFDTGLAEAIAGTFVAASGVSDVWTLTLIVTVFTIFFTEICSNTATANMLAPLVIAMARELEVSAIPPVLAVGIAATCGFMLPVGTGPNALVYGTRKVDQWTMIKVGFFVDLVSIVVIFVALRILCPLYGWD